MNKKTAVENFQQGKLLAVAEYRSGAAVVIPYTDKKTLKPSEFCKVVHNLEVGGQPVAVNERLADAAAVAAWKPRFKKGQPVVWAIGSFETINGACSGAGTVEALED